MVRKEENKKERSLFPEIAGPTYQSLASQLTRRHKVQYACQIRRFKDTGDIGKRQENQDIFSLHLQQSIQAHSESFTHPLCVPK